MKNLRRMKYKPETQCMRSMRRKADRPCAADGASATIYIIARHRPSEPEGPARRSTSSRGNTHHRPLRLLPRQHTLGVALSPCRYHPTPWLGRREPVPWPGSGGPPEKDTVRTGARKQHMSSLRPLMPSHFRKQAHRGLTCGSEALSTVARDARAACTAPAGPAVTAPTSQGPEA
jgi:hypothetical protein